METSQHIEKNCCPACNGAWSQEDLSRGICRNIDCKCHFPIEKNWEEEIVALIEDIFIPFPHEKDKERFLNAIRREKQLSYQAGKDAACDYMMQFASKLNDSSTFRRIVEAARSQEGEEV